MSIPFLRQTRASHLSAARRSLSRCRCNSSLATQPRHELEHSDSAPVAGPSNANVSNSSSGTQRKLTSTASQDSDIVEPFSRVQSYLALINASGIEPTRSDLDRYKPNRPHIHSPKYAEVYTATLNTLLRSFTKEQLRKFLVQELGTSRHCATNRKKADYAESVLEQLWKWPKLADVEQAKRDKIEVVTQELPVTVSQLFLILGKDGMDLKRMSQDFDVHISLKRRTKSLALRVEGPRSGVRELFEHIAVVSRSFTSQEFDLPFPMPIPPDMIERISRLSQAFVEDITNGTSSLGKVRITAKGPHGLEAATRLTSRAIHEISEISTIPILAYLPLSATHSTYLTDPIAMFPQEYALFPYLSPRDLPLSMNTSNAFRLRRVGEWLSGRFQEDLDMAEGIKSGKGHFVADFDRTVQLKDLLLHMPGAGMVVVKASLGHMLLTRSSKERATLVPPLTGQHSFSKIRKWMAHNPAVKMAFVPDLPLPLLNTSPTHQKVIHRLVYHSLSPSPNLELPATKAALASRDDTQNSSSAPLQHRHFFTIEVTLEGPNSPKYQNTPDGDALDEILRPDGQVQLETSQGIKEPQPSMLIFSASRCWYGLQSNLNVMMPGRPMDLQFSVESSADLPASQQPPEMQQYLKELEAFLNGSEAQPNQPSPPLQMQHQGVHYLLRANASVRQSEEEIIRSPAPFQSIKSDKEMASITRAVCESILDLESNQKAMHCQVACSNVTSEDAWKQFLQDCDTLSNMTHHSPKSIPFANGTEQFI